MLLASGMDVVRVSKLLGHSSAHVTLTVHAHVIAGVGDDTAAGGVAVLCW
jgi:site-specific recombinase XerD